MINTITDKESQIFRLPNSIVKVAGDGITQHVALDSCNLSGHNINIIGHDIEVLPDMFTISHPGGSFGLDTLDIKVAAHQPSNFFKFLINSSRLYWRDELEVRTASMSPAAADTYISDHKFNIDGPLLTPEEIRAQKQCLINKIFTIGYLLHNYKSQETTWIPFVLDSTVDNDKNPSGCSGKSFMFRALSNFTRCATLSGCCLNRLEFGFGFETLKDDFRVAVVDDYIDGGKLKHLCKVAMGDLEIHEIMHKPHVIPFQSSPKFVIISNNKPKRLNKSIASKLRFVYFSDYYHMRTGEDDYLETRQIRTDFNKNLFCSEYTEAEWEADINFVLQCVKFYLSIAPLQL